MRKDNPFQINMYIYKYIYIYIMKIFFDPTHYYMALKII